MLALRIVEIIFPIFSIVGLGLLVGWRFKFDMSVANTLNIDIFAPALMFSVIVGHSFELGDYTMLVLAAAGIVIFSGVISYPVCKIVNIHPKTLLPPIMFTNSGNMGLPLFALAFGESALPAAALLFMVETGIHFVLGTYLLNRQAKIRSVFITPLMLCTLAALAANLIDWSPPKPVLLPIEMLGQICIPLMLFSLGVRLADADLSEWRIGLIAAVLTPLSGLLLAFLSIAVFDLNPQQEAMLILFGALPPAVLNFIFAERYKQEPTKVAAIVIIGNALTIISIPLALAYVLSRYPLT